MVWVAGCSAPNPLFDPGRGTETSGAPPSTTTTLSPGPAGSTSPTGPGTSGPNDDDDPTTTTGSGSTYDPTMGETESETQSETDATNVCEDLLPCEVADPESCPPLHKCSPIAPDYLEAHCIPLAIDPGTPGDQCTPHDCFRGGDGHDECDALSICIAFFEECLAFCEQPDGACPAGYTCAFGLGNGTGLTLCAEMCDPFIQSCTEGSGCYPTGADWVCIPDASGGLGMQDDPCDAINTCDPGLVCAGPENIPGCVGTGCCTEICDLSDPVCPGGLNCEPLYVFAPPGLENVGFCAVIE